MMRYRTAFSPACRIRAGWEGIRDLSQQPSLIALDALHEQIFFIFIVQVKVVRPKISRSVISSMVTASHIPFQGSGIRIAKELASTAVRRSGFAPFVSERMFILDMTSSWGLTGVCQHL
jgi:hypothetical protein